MARSTGGAQAPSGTYGGNTDQGTGSTHPAKPHKPNKPKNPKPHKPKQPTGGAPLNAQTYGQPLDYNAAAKLAKLIGGLQYDPQISVIKGQQARVPDYFTDYRNQLANAQTQTQQLAAPVIAQSQTAQNNVGQTLGLTGPAANDDALAAASRAQQQAAMTAALQGIQGANDTYYNQTAANSYGAQATAAQQLGQQLASLKGQRSNANVDALLGIRNDDRNYNLEVQTLLGNQANDRAQAANTRANIKAGVTKAKISAQAKRQSTRIQTRKDRAEFIAKYGIPPEQVRDGLTPQEKREIKHYQRTSRKSGAPNKKTGLTPYQQSQRRKQSGQEINRITAISRDYDIFAAQRNTDKTTGKVTKPSVPQIKAQLRQKGYDGNEIHLALTIRDGNPLTKQDVRTAHRLGILKVPKGWIKPYGNGGPGATGNTPPGGGGRGPTSSQRPT